MNDLDKDLQKLWSDCLNSKEQDLLLSALKDLEKQQLASPELKTKILSGVRPKTYPFMGFKLRPAMALVACILIVTIITFNKLQPKSYQLPDRDLYTFLTSDFETEIFDPNIKTLEELL